MTRPIAGAGFLTPNSTGKGEMPEWPKREDFYSHSMSFFGRDVLLRHTDNYERALRIAWEARARLMYAELREIADHPDYDNGYALDARKVLNAIGELPKP